MKDNKFYQNKKVFVTGHTGFKGSWLCKLLLELGADVYGYSLKAEGDKLLFGLSNIENDINNTYGDIRDLASVERSIMDAKPDIVIHMAAQPIVREGYKNPVQTYSTNVMGTVNILEAVRKCETIKSVINVTTDKVYKNVECQNGYIEDDMLNGFDPYSNSKSCSELVTSAYVNSFLNEKHIAVSTCRAGNVLGGGDFAKDRIIPDCFRAARDSEAIIIRNPNSVRPYQHVLDPLTLYLLIAQKQYEDIKFSGNYNIGPNDIDNVTTGKLVELFCGAWGNNLQWKAQNEKGAPHEANYLYLNCDKVKRLFGWRPVWGIAETINKTVEWYQEYNSGKDVSICMIKQINKFMQDGGLV